LFGFPLTDGEENAGTRTSLDRKAGTPMKELVEEIAKALVDHPEGVQVKVIGRQGRTAKAIRTLLGAAGMKLHKRFTLEILED